MGVPDFSLIRWGSDGFSVDGWEFREHPDTHHGEPLAAGDWFWIFKPRSMIDEYAAVFASRPEFVATNILELGIWAGGSVAFWALIARPDRMSALDLDGRGDPEHVRRFVAEHPHVNTWWSTDQSDEAAIETILERDALKPLDVVIDDASHLYRASRRSFEILFPRLRTGGLYLLEDWQWSFEPEYQAADAPLATQRPLVNLVHDMVAVMGSQPGLIAKIEVYPKFVVVERGDAALPATFAIDGLVRRRARPSLSRRSAQISGKLQREVARFTRRSQRR